MVPLEYFDEPRKIGIRAQLFGVGTKESSVARVSTPRGLAVVTTSRELICVEGVDIPTVTIEVVRPPTITALKRGLTCIADGTTLTISRPTFGLLRRDRDILVSGPGVALRVYYERSRRFGIVRDNDKSPLFRQEGSQRLVDVHATPQEVAIALAVVASGVVLTSSLINFLSPP